MKSMSHGMVLRHSDKMDVGGIALAASVPKSTPCRYEMALKDKFFRFLAAGQSQMIRPELRWSLQAGCGNT